MYGQYEKLMHELTTEDQTSFNNFLRVDPDIFMKLLHRVGPRIEKHDTFFRKALPPGLKLAVTLQFGRRREYGRRGQSTDAGGGSTERVRSHYGLTLSAVSAAYVKHEITFKIGLRIGAEIHRHSTDTVRIQYGSLA